MSVTVRQSSVDFTTPDARSTLPSSTVWRCRWEKDSRSALASLVSIPLSLAFTGGLTVSVGTRRSRLSLSLSLCAEPAQPCLNRLSGGVGHGLAVSSPDFKTSDARPTLPSSTVWRCHHRSSKLPMLARPCLQARSGGLITGFHKEKYGFHKEKHGFPLDNH